MKMDELLAVMAQLRDRDTGCLWNQQQTMATLVPHTLEEAYELAEAISMQSPEKIKTEVGDLLLQVIFYAQLAKEVAWFDFNQVVDSLIKKIKHRHPHVFGEKAAAAKPPSMSSLAKNWESVKQAERQVQGETGLMADLPRALPSLSRAAKIQKRATKVGFNAQGLTEAIASARDALAKCESAAPDAQMSAVGELLFTCTNIARNMQVDAEAALRATNHKFITEIERTHKVGPFRPKDLEET